LPETQLEEMIGNSELPLRVPNEVPTTSFRSAEELRTLRDEIDPKGMRLRPASE